MSLNFHVSATYRLILQWNIYFIYLVVISEYLATTSKMKISLHFNILNIKAEYVDIATKYIR